MNLKSIFFLLFGIVSLHFSSQIVITEVYHDTPYNERLTLKSGMAQLEENARKHHWGEFIELYNYSDKDISLKDWYLQDYVQTYWFPDKIIKSGEFVVVVYSQLIYDTTEFTALFPTTLGKEDKIIRQNLILLRNKKDNVKLGYSPFGQRANFNKGSVEVGSGIEPPSNRKRQAWTYPNICYSYPSVQLTSHNVYSNGVPNPLESLYKPPIQNYEEILWNDYQNYYAFLDFADQVTNLNNTKCLTSISLTSQTPSGSFDQGKRCFFFDSAGNIISSNDCSNPGNGGQSNNGYTFDELESIKNSISLYPNPSTSSNQYTVHISWSGAAINKISNLQVHNTGGGLVFGLVPTNGMNSTSFSLQGQLPGVFVANFTLNTGQVISKNILKW